MDGEYAGNLDKKNALKGKGYRKLNEPPETTEIVTHNNATDRELLLREAEEQFNKQDIILDELGNIVKNIKHDALDMNTELEKHNVVIEDITNQVDDTHERLHQNTKKISKIIREKTCCSCLCGDNYFWIICVILLVAIFAAIILIIIFGKLIK